MTIFAGLLSRRDDGYISEDAKADLRTFISRVPGHDVIEHSIGHGFVVHVDIGAFGDSGSAVDEAGLTLVVGDPILKDGSIRSSVNRTQDVEFLHRRFAGGDVSLLSSAAGTFAGLHIPRTSGTPFLFVDKFGIRQLFVAEHGEFYAFSTALRVLERLGVLPKNLEFESLTEQAELRWPLGRRTPYESISLLGGAEILYLGSQPSSKSYWSWPGTVDRGLSIDDHIWNCHEKFQDALRSRLAEDNEALAFLSGGLDSRSVVAGLRGLGKSVNAINYAPPRTQDRVYAKQFGDLIGCNFLQISFSPKLVDAHTLHSVVRKFVEECCTSGKLSLDRPSCIWTGNGGTVGLGHNHISEELVSALEDGDFELVLKYFRESDRTGLTRRPLCKKFYEQYCDWPDMSFKEELRKFESEEPGRAFYFFLMANHQRRSLHEVFEDIDLAQLEFLMPFFDSDFLEAVAQVPVDECLYHKFYVRWLDCFGSEVSAVPWQSYPGHIPCPVKDDQDLGYQFGSGFSAEWSRAMSAIRLQKAKEMAIARHFPSHVLSRSSLVMAYFFALARSDRLGYSIEKGYEYFRHWKLANSQESC